MAILLDQTTKAEYDALSLASARASAVVSALTGTVVVEVYNGVNTLVASGTMAAPWATASGATITVGEVTGVGLLVTTGGAPDATWYCQFRSGSRFVRGTFGVLGSGRDFVWSLASFQTGSRGTLGTVVLTAVAASGLTPGYEPAWLSQVTGADSTYDPPLETTGTILYVATTGNDTTGNGTIGNPYLTISKANSMLTAGVGGTIYVRGGTYSMASGPVYLKGGTSLSWTKVRRYPGETVFLDGGFATNAPFESVDRGGYLEIHGFKTQYFNVWGVFVDRNGGSNYLMRNCTALESAAALKFASNGSAVTPAAVATDITIENVVWQQTASTITASVSSSVLTITAITGGFIYNGSTIYIPNPSDPSNPTAIGQIQSRLSGTPGSIGTFQFSNPAANYSSQLMILTYTNTGIDFGTGVCSNISIDLVKIQRINPFPTGNTGADGIAVETGGNITIDRAYVKDVDGDCIDIKNDLGNYTLKRSVGIQINSGRNIFKAWPGVGYTSTFDNCLGYRASTYNTGPELVAFAGTTGSHTMRRCTIINDGLNGQVVISRWAPGTTKTSQGCILSKPNAANTGVLIDVNSNPEGTGGSDITNFKYNLFYSPGRTDAIIRNNVAFGTPTAAVSQTDISGGAFDTTYAAAGMVGNAVGQPSYENAGALNFRLAAGDTAALNKYLTNNGISTDADGLIGTVNDYQDIGAFERQ